MKVCKIPKNSELPTLYFYDFETCVDANGYMVPFYCVVQKVCASCDEKIFEKSEERFIPTDQCYHPYHFIDLNYIGPMVGLEYFDPSGEGTKYREKFNQWYAEQQLKNYVFRDVIYYYCRLDVDILRQGCVKFARLIKNIMGIFPFYDRTCHTIASLALKIYRSNFLSENIIGQIPATEYVGNINQSAVALCWISELETEIEEVGHTLRSKLLPEGEQSISNRFVDSYCKETNTNNNNNMTLFNHDDV